MEKEEAATTAASIAGKLFSILVIILPPFIAANVAHWSASVLTGKKMTKRSRFAMSMGSLSVAFATMWICDLYGMNNNWRTVIIWFATLTSDKILIFLYTEFGDIMKEWLKTALTQSLNKLTKKDK